MKNQKKIKELNHIQAFEWIYAHLPKFRKKQFWFLFILMVVTAGLETIALGSVAFFASAVTDPSNVLLSKYVSYLKPVLPDAFFRSATELIIVSGCFMVLMILCKNVVKAVSIYGMERFSAAMEAHFGETLLSGFLNLPYQWHLQRNSADLINAVQWRLYLGRMFFRPYLTLFNDLLMVVVLFLSLFVVQPVISFMVLSVLGGAALFLYTVIRNKIDVLSEISKDYQIHINKETTMAVQGIKDVKIYRRKKSFVQKFIDKAIPLAKIMGHLRMYAETPAFILETLGFMMLWLSICVMLIALDITTAYITGTVALLAVTAWKVLPVMTLILNNITVLRNSLPFVRSQIEYISIIENNRAHRQTEQKELLNFKNRIFFDQVTFAYEQDDRWIIDHLSFEIQKGETIGIIGVSGAGKSTLVDLLIGLLDPVEGKIYVDKQVLGESVLPAWHGMTGYVSQSPYIYDDTLAANIAFGVIKEQIDKERVKACCSMAAMDDFLSQMPDGIESLIGERGMKLSGGQRQRVAIARALYHEPEIMIFDEATSSLDTKSEKAIMETIYSFKGKQTLIIIAHRLTTVESCDKVIWIEQGRLKMIGTAETVLKQYHQQAA